MARQQMKKITLQAHGMTLTQARSLARRIARAASDEGTIQAADMLDLAGRRDPSRPLGKTIVCEPRRTN